MLTEFINTTMGVGTLAMQALVVIILVSYFYVRYLGEKLPRAFKPAWDFIKENSLLMAFLVVLFGTIGSLIYSEVLGFEACSLCWYQRALIYPQVFILGVAVYKKNKEIFDYVVGLNIFGILIAGYQYYFQMLGRGETCPIGEIDCFKIYLLELGYITIPLMALTLFVFVLIMTYIWKKTNLKSVKLEEM